MRNRKTHRIVKGFIKILPVIGTIAFAIHAGLLLQGINLPYAETLVGPGVIFSLLLALLSIDYGFCILHELMCLYMIAMEFCICFERHAGFGALLTPARWFMFVCGCLLIWQLISHLKEYINANTRKERELDKIDVVRLFLEKAKKDTEVERAVRRITTEVINEVGVVEQMTELMERVDELESEKSAKFSIIHKE